MIAWLSRVFAGDALSRLVGAVSEHLRGRRAARDAAAAVDARVRLAKAETDGKLQLASHELQVLRTRGQDGSWKDEYVTLLVSAPILVGIAGALAQAAHPPTGAALLAAADAIRDLMTGGAIDYPTLWMIVVTVSLGTRPLRT